MCGDTCWSLDAVCRVSCPSSAVLTEFGAGSFMVSKSRWGALPWVREANKKADNVLKRNFGFRNSFRNLVVAFFFLIIWRDFTWCKVEFILFSLEQNKTSPTQQQQRSLSNVRVYLLVIMEGCDADGMWAQVLPLWPHCLSKPRPKWKQKPVAASETWLIESGILSLLLVTQWLGIALEV